MITETFVVKGMSCGACAAHVTNALKSVRGVHSASVSLKDNNVIVEFDPETSTVTDLASAVEDEGYQLLLPSAGETDLNDGR